MIISFMLIISILMCCSMMMNQKPLFMVMSLVILSVAMAVVINFLISTWYSYILFLVYVGGMLVLFIYICMISSNLNLIYEFNIFKFFLMLMFFGSMIINDPNFKFILGSSGGMSSNSFPLFLLLSLGIYLMLVFILILYIIFWGGVSFKIEF